MVKPEVSNLYLKVMESIFKAKRSRLFASVPKAGPDSHRDEPAHPRIPAFAEAASAGDAQFCPVPISIGSYGNVRVYYPDRSR